MGVILCFTVLILTVIFFIRFLDKPVHTRPNANLHTQPVASPLTPERTSPAENEGSPRTPQPFIDYVRRTIDETPYYRRERRRRFDPQNTYWIVSNLAPLLKGTSSLESYQISLAIFMWVVVIFNCYHPNWSENL